jgi:hypothetical protein
MSVVRLCSVLAMVVTIAGAGHALARQAGTPPLSPNLRVEGDWVRTDPEGSGSFDGLAAQFPTAELTPAGVEARGAGGGRGGRGAGRGGPPPAAARGGAAPTTGPRAAGEPYVVSAMPCGGRGGGAGYGGGLITPDSGGVHIVAGKDEVVYAGERGGVRHIYMDGRKHPDLSRWTPIAAGHSTGRFEGSTLIVETVGFTAGAVPGGGWRTPETQLTERFEVQPDGKSLRVTYTWTDPKIFAKPHTYRLIFDRAPGDVTYAFDEWCDASDPVEGQSIVPPKQIKVIK